MCSIICGSIFGPLLFLIFVNDLHNSPSHHYAQLGNALQNYCFAYSTLIMGTLKGSTGQFFNFIAQSQNFTGSPNGPDLP